GLQARLMSQAMRKLTGVAHRTGAMVIFINQTREKIGGMGYGPRVTTTGGNALKFYASVRLDVRRIGAVKEGDAVIGNQTRVKVVKNKIAPPFREALFEIVYGKGVNRPGELLDLGVAAGVIQKAGAWFSYGGEKLGQGRVAACAWLASHAQEASDIQTLVNEGVVDNAA
ncbi:MAG: hypothetical protein KC492_26820, partial [Myxococcales bacterium]|nr:hypothetical protein [Myxococcales bacterium]